MRAVCRRGGPVTAGSYAKNRIVSYLVTYLADCVDTRFCHASHILGLSSWHTHNRYAMLVGIARGMCLCDVPTPALLLDHSTAATWRGISPRELDAALNDANAASSSVSYTHLTLPTILLV